MTIAGSPASQGGEPTVGYRDRSSAVVPVTVAQGGGTVTRLNATASTGFSDALLTPGQLETRAEGGSATARVGLGKFLATGLVAKVLGDGFAPQLSGQAGSGGGSPP